MKGKVNFVLNAHLPFVRHPEFSKFLEEDWLFEAMNESYIPLLRMLYKLKEEEICFKMTFSLSPTLVAMLNDKILQEKFVAYMESRKELGNKELARVASDKTMKAIVEMYNKEVEANLEFYNNTCQGNIIKAFNELSNEGILDLITTAATHAFLPVYKDFPIAVNAQIETSLTQHLRTFDKLSEGFWLPECAYYPGLDEILRHHNLKWTVLAPQSFVLSNSKAKNGIYAPIVTKSGLYCFARDYSLCSRILSGDGYPSDPVYREFYRDIGYDLPMNYIEPYIHEPQIRVFTGFKYWAITGKTADKVPYNPAKANEKALIHAKDFVSQIFEKTKQLNGSLDCDPVFTICFDAELLGHRWYEGINWLEYTIREVCENNNLEFTIPSQIIKGNDKIQSLEPAFSSASQGGFCQELIDNNNNAWLLRHVFKAVERMTELADKLPNQKSLKQRILNQAARETLLAMSGDWPVIMHNNTCSEYAKKRVICHLQSVDLVYEDMCKNAVNTEWLVKAEKRDNLFPKMDYNTFSSKHFNDTSKIFTTQF